VRARAVAPLIAAAGVGVGVGAALALAHDRPAPVLAAAPALHAQAVWPNGARRAPDFRLRDQSGRAVTLSSQRGRVVLLAFLDSRCRTECPVEGRLLADVQRRTRAQLLVVTVDPWSDTWLTVRTFAAEARWRAGWHWLLGTPAQLEPVWARYGVGVQRARNDVRHTAVVYVIDRRGFERAAYLVPFAPTAIASETRRLESS
jgi:cytochrome oxidase Cu insertion factor (SCO1/SenC/PrrC family)